HPGACLTHWRGEESGMQVTGCRQCVDGEDLGGRDAYWRGGQKMSADRHHAQACQGAPCCLQAWCPPGPLSLANEGLTQKRGQVERLPLSFSGALFALVFRPG